MKIRTKLILNTMLIVLFLLGLNLAIFHFLNIVSQKQDFLVLKSTPYQIKVTELQKALQAFTGEMVKLSYSKNRSELDREREVVKQRLEEIKRVEDELNAMSGKKVSIYSDLYYLYEEMTKTVEERLTAEDRASRVSRVLEEKLKTSTMKLQDLDNKIKSLQLNRFALFSTALEETRTSYEELLDIVSGRSLIKELLSIIGKVDASMRMGDFKSAQDYLQSAKQVFGKLRKVSSLRGIKNVWQKVGQIEHLLEETNKSLSQNKPIDIKQLQNLIEQADKDLEKEIGKLKEKVEVAKGTQEKGQVESSVGMNILLDNAALISLGLKINALGMGLLSSVTKEELFRSRDTLQGIYHEIAKLNERLEKNLKKLKAEEEIKYLQSAVRSLQETKEIILGGQGIVSALSLKIDLENKSKDINIRIREYLERQIKEGEQSVVLAYKDQEQAVREVHQAIVNAKKASLAIGGGVIGIALFFSLFLIISISRSIGRLLAFTQRLSQGELSCAEIKASRDEIGLVTKRVCEVVDRIASIVGEIQSTIMKEKEIASRLHQQADKLTQTSAFQYDLMEIVSAGTTELSITSQDIVERAKEKSAEAQRTQGLLHEGKENIGKIINYLEHIEGHIELTAKRIGELQVSSQTITEVVEVIQRIAEQIKLLALNATIEAARAGAAGKGFSVVAENVRQLATKTSEVTQNISQTIENINQSVLQVISQFNAERESLHNIVKEISYSLGSFDEIIGKIDEIIQSFSEILQTTSQQHTAIDEISGKVLELSKLNNELNETIKNLRSMADELTRVTDKLADSAAWFKV